MLSGRRKRGSKEVPDFPLERLAQKHFRALLEINCETTKVISFASHAWPGPEWQNLPWKTFANNSGMQRQEIENRNDNNRR